MWSDPWTTAGGDVNFSVQQYEGQPVLTWFEGEVGAGGLGHGSYVIMNQHYQQVARVEAGNGYTGDLHDFQITPQNTALFTVYNSVVTDATSVGGARDQIVTEGIVQEVDIPTGVVLFEWHSLGNIALSESYEPVPKSANENYDYVHENSIALDADQNIIVSACHTSAIYKIDHTTGALYWRLGGKLDNFSEKPDTVSVWQHDARLHPDGTITIYDNGASEVATTHPASRGIVVQLDQHAMTATLIHSYTTAEAVTSTSQGNMQLLANGNYLIGWGAQPEITEFNSDGHVVYDVKFPTTAPRDNVFSVPRLPIHLGRNSRRSTRGLRVDRRPDDHGIGQLERRHRRRKLGRRHRTKPRIPHRNRHDTTNRIRNHDHRGHHCRVPRGRSPRRRRQRPRHITRPATKQLTQLRMQTRDTERHSMLTTSTECPIRCAPVRQIWRRPSSAKVLPMVSTREWQAETL